MGFKKSSHWVWDLNRDARMNSVGKKKNPTSLPNLFKAKVTSYMKLEIYENQYINRITYCVTSHRLPTCISN